MKQDITLNLDTKGLEVGTKFAIFENITELKDENSNIEQNTTDSNNNIELENNSNEAKENIEKTFLII